MDKTGKGDGDYYVRDGKGSTAGAASISRKKRRILYKKKAEDSNGEVQSLLIRSIGPTVF